MTEWSMSPASPPPPPPGPPARKKKHWGRRILIGAGGLIVLIVIISVATNSGSSKGKNAAASAPSVPAAASSAASTSMSMHAATTRPKPSAAPTRNNSSAKRTVLGAGSFTVGTDVPPGRYVISAAKGESGNLVGATKSDPAAINDVLGDTLGFGVPSVTADLTKGETITLSNLAHVTFAPAVTKLRTSLTTGDWQVGLDIKPGRYVATPGHGETGNFVVYEHGFPAVNEVLGGSGGLGVPNVTVTLKGGEEIDISGIATVRFVAK